MKCIWKIYFTISQGGKIYGDKPLNYTEGSFKCAGLSQLILKNYNSRFVPEYKWIIYDAKETACMGLEWINLTTNDYLRIEESLIEYLRPCYKDDMQ